MCFRKVFVKPDGTFYKEGDVMVRPELANTLEKISQDADAFYKGSLARDIIADL